MVDHHLITPNSGYQDARASNASEDNLRRRSAVMRSRNRPAGPRPLPTTAPLSSGPAPPSSSTASSSGRRLSTGSSMSEWSLTASEASAPSVRIVTPLLTPLATFDTSFVSPVGPASALLTPPTPFPEDTPLYTSKQHLNLPELRSVPFTATATRPTLAWIHTGHWDNQAQSLRIEATFSPENVHEQGRDEVCSWTRPSAMRFLQEARLRAVLDGLGHLSPSRVRGISDTLEAEQLDTKEDTMIDSIPEEGQEDLISFPSPCWEDIIAAAATPISPSSGLSSSSSPSDHPWLLSAASSPSIIPSHSATLRPLSPIVASSSSAAISDLQDDSPEPELDAGSTAEVGAITLPRAQVAAVSEVQDGHIRQHTVYPVTRQKTPAEKFEDWEREEQRTLADARKGDERRTQRNRHSQSVGVKQRMKEWADKRKSSGAF